MPYNTNTPTYNTRNSKIQNFRDFDSNTEKEELGKAKRSFTKNDNEVYDLPNEFKYKYNKSTHKIDDIDLDMVDDKIDAIEESFNHIKSFNKF